MQKVVIKRVTVPHDDFLDFMDAMKDLRPHFLDIIYVSKNIFFKLASGGKWYHRNHTEEYKPILEFEWIGNGWYLVREFRGIRRDTSIYDEATTIYVVQFDDELPVEITVKWSKKGETIVIIVSLFLPNRDFFGGVPKNLKKFRKNLPKFHQKSLTSYLNI